MLYLEGSTCCCLFNTSTVFEPPVIYLHCSQASQWIWCNRISYQPTESSVFQGVYSQGSVLSWKLVPPYRSLSHPHLLTVVVSCIQPTVSLLQGFCCSPFRLADAVGDLRLWSPVYNDPKCPTTTVRLFSGLEQVMVGSWGWGCNLYGNVQLCADRHTHTYMLQL